MACINNTGPGLNTLGPSRNYASLGDFQLEAGIAERYPDMLFRVADVESLPFADGEFDTVICTHVLEHVLHIDRTIAELRRLTARRVRVGESRC